MPLLVFFKHTVCFPKFLETQKKVVVWLHLSKEDGI